jgi:hypothetical protein
LAGGAAGLQQYLAAAAAAAAGGSGLNNALLGQVRLHVNSGAVSCDNAGTIQSGECRKDRVIAVSIIMQGRVTRHVCSQQCAVCTIACSNGALWYSMS